MLIKEERGVALVLALAVIALLVSLVVDFSYTMMVDLTLAANLRDEQKAFYIARSGVELARHVLQQDTADKDHADYDGLDEEWAQLPEHPGFLSDDDEGRFKVTIEDETGKFPINKLVIEDQTTKEYTVDKNRLPQFQRLFDALDLDRALIDPIIDWLDSDPNPGPNGAEDAYYQSLPSPYHCKNGPLDSLDELLLVKGMTKEILYGTEEKKGLIHFLTLYSAADLTKLNININTASAAVIYSLSTKIERNQAQDVENYLKEKPLTGKVQGEWNEVIDPLVGSTDISTDLGNQCVIKSLYFSVRAEGKVRDIKKVIYTVLQRDKGKGIKPVFWRIE